MDYEGAVLYFPILEYLYKYGFGVKVDISHLFKDIHPEQMSLADAANFRVENFFHFLDYMVKNGHIVYDKPILDIYDLAIDGKHKWDMKIPIMAAITINGMLLHYQKLQIDSVLSSNQLAISSYALTRKNIWMTFGIALAGFLIALGTFIMAVAGNDDKQHIQELKTQLSRQSIELTKQQTLLHRIDSLLYLDLKKQEKHNPPQARVSSAGQKR